MEISTNHNALSEILAENYGVPSEAARAAGGNYLRAFRKCPDNPSKSLDAWRHLLWKQALGDQYSSLAGEIYLKWLQLRYYYLALTPDVVALLNRLQTQYMLGLITNGPSAAQWEKVERLNLKSYFDIILVSGDLPWEKPHQQIFHEACEYLGVEPRQCLMVGDKLETDILGGIHAKLGATVWIPLSGADQPHGIDPDYIIQAVTDLPNLLPKNTGRMGKLRRPKSVFSRLNRNLDLDDCNSNSSDGS